MSLGVSLAPALASAAPGDFDPSWGTGGLISTGDVLPSLYPLPGDSLVAAQSTGKILSALSTGGNSAHSEVDVRRFDTNGESDSSFLTAVAERCGRAKQLAIESDDSALLLTDGCLIHVPAGGGTDSQFGDDGIVALNSASSFATDSVGNILIASIRAGGQDRLQRFDASGQIDSSFGNDGTLSLENLFDYDPNQPQFHLRVDKIAVDSSDRIILAGVGGRLATGATVARLTPSGTRDDNFGSHGTLSVSANNSDYDPRVHGLALEADGNIDVLSSDDEPQSGGTDLAAGELAQVTSSGSLDAGFADGGVLSLKGSGGPPNIVTVPQALAVGPGDDLIVAGQREYGGSGCCGLGDSIVARIDATTGQFEPGFAGDGINRFEFEGPDAANDVTIVGSTVYVAGTRSPSCCWPADSDAYPYLARLQLGAGSPDLDADGVGDSADRCPSVYDPAGEGCPDYTVKPTVVLDPRSFHGKRLVAVSVATDSQACISDPLHLQRRKHGKWAGVEKLQAPNPFFFSVGTLDLAPGRYRLVARDRSAVRVKRGSESPAIADCVGLSKTFSI